MNRLIALAAGSLLAFTLVACQSSKPSTGAAGSPAAAPAAAASAKSRGDTYFPYGETGATAVIRPTGRILIVSIDSKAIQRGGKPVGVTARQFGRAYKRIALPPGSYRIYAATTGSPLGKELSLTVAAGEHRVAALTYKSAGKSMWTPVVAEDDEAAIVVGAPNEILVGMSTRAATRMMRETEGGTRMDKAGKEAMAVAGLEKLLLSANKHYAAGRALFDRRDYTKALGEFDAALKLAGGLESAHAYRGMTLFRLRRAAESLAALDRAIELGERRQPVDRDWTWWPHLHRGHSLMALRRVDEAIAAYGRSIEFKPTTGARAGRANANLVKARVLMQSGDRTGAQRHLDHARGDIELVVKLAPNKASGWAMKSGIHIMSGDMSQGCHAARRACELGNCRIIREFTECR